MSKRVAAGILAIGLASGLLRAQEPRVEELRFHRVHLVNGNFIDGELLRRTPEEVVLKMKGGELGIRVDLIRSVEFVKIRSIREAPVVESPRPRPAAAPPADAPDPFATLVAAPAFDGIPAPRIAPAPREPAQLFEAAPELRERLDPLLRDLDAADIEQKSVVAERIAEAGGAGAPYLASLLEKAQADAFPHLVLVLLRLKDAGAVPVLGRLLESPRPEVRAQAAAVLAATGAAAADAAPSLLSLLKDREAEVRVAALRALRGLNEDLLRPHLPHLCADAERRVRSAAISTYLELSRRVGESPIAGLAGALGRSEGVATLDLLEAIVDTKRPEGGAILAVWLGSDRSEARAAAAAGLASVGGPVAEAAVAARLPREQDRRVRLELARAAGKLAVLKAAPPLIAWLDDPDDDVRAAALQALRAATGQTFGPERERWAAWWDKAKPGD